MTAISRISQRASPQVLGHFFLIGSLLFGVMGQLLLKYALVQGRVAGASWHHYLWLLSGLAIYAIGIGCWLLCLGYLDLSYAYPFTGLTYVFVLVASWRLFGDSMSWYRVSGVLVICVGVLLISARSRKIS